MKLRLPILILALLWSALAIAVTAPGSAGVSTTTNGTTTGTLFTPLHTYYMSPTGSDTANGLTPGTAWATPNHATVCGDVIIAAAGTYTSSFQNWGAVSTCPSTTGGIDGAGGINFAVLLCAGPNVGACNTNNQLWVMGASNWAVEGWKVTNTSSSGSPGRAWNINGCSAIIHHFAFVNDIADSASAGYHIDDCGSASTTVGVDYFAVVGSIAHQSALNTSFCEASIDAVGPGATDTAAGAHVYFYGNFSWYNRTDACTIDAEGMMFDAWDARSYSNLGVMANNVLWGSTRYGIQLFTPDAAASSPSMKVYNNTVYNNNQAIGSDFADGEINVSLGRTWTIGIYRNIAKSITADTHHYALVNGGGSNPGTTIGGTGIENIFKGAATGCAGTLCGGTNDITAFNSNPVGTNFYEDPAFNSTADIDARWQSAVPYCPGYDNVTKCMGYDANTLTLRTGTPIYDLTANCVHCGSKGYTLSSTTCGSTLFDGDYPAWLKGIVWLKVVGSSIYQQHDLVTTPCGL